MARVAGLLADRLAELGLDGQPVRAVALRHERAFERLAVDHPADPHEAARAEERRGIVRHDAGPRIWVVALAKPGVDSRIMTLKTLADDGPHRRQDIVLTYIEMSMRVLRAAGLMTSRHTA